MNGLIWAVLLPHLRRLRLTAQRPTFCLAGAGLFVQYLLQV